MFSLMQISNFSSPPLPRERARRRFLESKRNCSEADIDAEIERDIIARDKTDSTREFAPLRQAEDAILVDTTDMNREQSGRILFLG